MSARPLIMLSGVSLGYAGHPILEDVNFTVEQGEFVALLGPNGAGKTTLLRGMLGLIPVLAGRIEFGFDRVASPPGYVPQKETLDPIFPLTAHEVVIMGTYARLPPLKPAGRRERGLASAALEQVGLSSLAEHPFWSLSGGQKQRVLIARALTAEPEVLLLDEPTAGIDPGAATSIMDAISRLNREHGLTVVLVSHHLRLVRSLVRSVIWVDRHHATKGPTEVLLSPEHLEGIFGALAEIG
jgi:ABC-type Mn2+/Zn2+ transport system ATPase subunit